MQVKKLFISLLLLPFICEGQSLKKSITHQLLWTYELPSSISTGPVDFLVHGSYYFTKESIGNRYFVMLHCNITKIEHQAKFGTLRFRLNGKDYRQDQMNASDGLGMHGFDQLKIKSILARVEVQFLNNSKLANIGDGINYEVGDIDKNADLDKLTLNLAGSRLKNYNSEFNNILIQRINNLNKVKGLPEISKTKPSDTAKPKLNKTSPSNTVNTPNNKQSKSSNSTTNSNSDNAINSNESQNLNSDKKINSNEEKISANNKSVSDAEAIKRQQEYNEWRNKAQEEKNVRDAEAVAASIGVLTILGGFIYDGMGEVEPDFVYQSPTQKYKPMLFITNSFGYSFSMEPMLFQSFNSTMKNGSYVNTKSMKGESGYYLNLGANSNIGVQNDYYSAFGILGAKLGFEPTFSGFKYNFKVGFGADFGFKNVKFYFNSQYHLADYKSTTSSDVEELGEGESDLNPTEFGYGVKFTFGGDKYDDFKRQHIFLGLISKSYNFDGSSLFGYYDPINRVLSSNGTPTMNGFNFEWRKDHTFSLFFHFFDEHIYAGAINNEYINSSRSIGTDLFFEIGFHRAFDLFTQN